MANDLNIGSLIADQYKGTPAASNEMEAHGVESGLSYGEPVQAEVEQEEEQQETENKQEEETQPQDEVKDNVEEQEEQSESESTDTDSSLNSEDETSSEETTSTEETTFSIDDEVSKRTDGQYSSFDDMVEALNNPEEPKQHEYGNELIAKLDELAKQGVDVDIDFVTAQMRDYSKYDIENVEQAKALVEMELKLQEPDITQREIDFEFSERYKLDADEYDDVDIERSQMKLMRDAKKARKSLEENQKSMALPKGGVDPEKQRQMEQQQRESQERLAKTLTEAVDTYDKESFKIGDESFDYKLTDKVKKDLQDTMLNTDKFFLQYINKDGSIDTSKLRSDMLWLKNRDSIMSTLLSQATSKGSKDVVKEIKNTDFTKTKGAAPKTDYSIKGAISKHFETKNL